MSQPRHPLTDAGLDRLLDTWLGEGPESMADRVTEAALLSVSTTHQKHRGGLMSRFSPDRPAFRLATGLAAVVVIAAVGFGVWRSTDIGVDPTPTPSVEPAPSVTLTPSPQPTPIALDTHAYPRAGYAITLDVSWTEVVEGEFHNSVDPGPNLLITVGSPDGHITTCAFRESPGVGEVCPDRHYSDAAQMIDLLPQPNSNCVLCARTDLVGGRTVGGDKALLYRVSTLDGDEYYLFDVHRGRPYVIRVSPTIVTIGSAARDAVVVRLLGEALSGFRFLETTTYAYPEKGYSVTLTNDWVMWDPGAFHNPAKPERTVSVLAGTPDGRLAACGYGPYSIFGEAPSSGPPCSELIFHNASDLAAILQGTAVIGTIQLAGDDVPLYRHFTFDGYDYALVDVHDGRPFVVHLTWRYVADAFEVKAQEATRLMQEALSGFAFVP